MEIDGGENINASIAQDAYSSIEAELRSMLEVDETRLGDVYRLMHLDPGEIQQKLGGATIGFVYSYKNLIETLLYSKIPAGPTIAAQQLGRVKKWIKYPSLSDATRQYLESVKEQLEKVVADPERIISEDINAQHRTEEKEDLGRPGVYVYTLPHYRRYPMNPENGHTMYKIGMSARDVHLRIGQQSRQTALPEDLVLLRVYETISEHARAEEAEFHRWLEAADHPRSPSKTGGKEWFLTSLKMLDCIAKSRGLIIDEVVED